VSSIIAPFGDPIEARPSVPTAEERIAEKTRKKAEKETRRKERDSVEEKERGTLAV